MNLATKTMALCAITALLITGSALAQPAGKGMRGKGIQKNCPMCGQVMPKGKKGQKGSMSKANTQAWMYNPASVVTIKGEISSVDKIQPKNQRPNAKGYGVHLTVKTNQGDQVVHVGPSWYLDKQKLALNKGDKIEITGSKTNINKQDVIIAGQLTKGNQGLKLRNDDGTPTWKGQGQMSQQGRMGRQGQMSKKGMMKGSGQGMNMQNCPMQK